MFRPHFLWKLFAGYSILILVVISVAGYLWIRQIRESELRKVDVQLQDEALLFRELVRNDWPLETEAKKAEFQARVLSLGGKAITRFTLIAADGTVLAESERDPKEMQNHLYRPEVQGAIKSEIGRASRLSESIGKSFLYLATPFEPNDKNSPFIRVALSLDEIDKNLGELRNGVIFAAFLAGGVALLLGYFIIRKITAPLITVRSRVEALLEGKSPSNPTQKPISNDEFGSLFRAIDRLTGQLDERMEQITSDRNKLVTILGGLVEGVIAIDQEERIVHCNEVAARLLRVPPNEGEGKFMWEVIRITEITQTLSKTLKEETEVKAEVRLPGGLQRGQVLEMVGSPLHDGEGNLVGSVVLVNEVTELRRLESIRRDFVANVSHELKTPITAIRGLVETVLSDSEMPQDTQTRFLSKVNRQAIRLSSLVSDLLTLARLESEEEGLQAAKVDLGETLEDVIRPYRNQDEDQKVELEAVIPSNPIMVRGDEQSLRMVANNLIDNAIKYTPEGGKVWIRLMVENGSARFEVQDTGIGIDPDHLDRIFERFYRVDKARSRELGGTGLGLSIVKHAVLMHGGEVGVDSNPGQGSTFWVTIPLA